MSNDILECARRYTRKGVCVVPIPYKQKGPRLNGWQKLRLKSDDLPRYFPKSDMNIGCLCGEPSGGLIDVDCDCEEAVIAAHYFLPKTGLRHGRPGNRNSHYWYIAKKNLQDGRYTYEDAPTGKGKDKAKKKGATLIEIRSTGHQTVVPPSVHPSGERLQWEEDGEPAVVDGKELIRRVELVAAAALLARHWPGEGVRNDFSLALGGALLRHGFSVNEAKRFIRVAAYAAGDEEYLGRARNVESTANRLENDEPTTGLPTLKEMLQAEVVTKLCRTLHFEDADEDNELADTSDKKTSQAERMLDIANDVKLFRSERAEPYVRVSVNEHYENWPLRSKVFKTWLARQMFLETDKPPHAQAVDEALTVMAGKCLFNSEEYQLNVRVAKAGESIFIDMGDALWRAIEVTKDGWKIVEQPPILFRRHKVSKAHVDPARSGELDMLRDFLNLSNDDAWYLLASWLVSALIPDISHPPLVIHGEHGSAKTSCANLISALIDPTLVPSRSEPSNLKEWVQAADHSWLITLDNLSRLQPWLSDALCRAVTGDALSKRELYTDDDDILYSFRRVICLTGIGIVAQRADLLDRSILLGLEPISPSKRLLEREFMQSFEEARPLIFGALLDTLSGVLEELPNVRLKRLPRMADFARIGVAVERVLGWPKRSFLNAYGSNIECQHEEAIEASQVASAVRALMADEPEWESTCTELIDKLLDYAGCDGQPPRYWPRTGRKMRDELQRAAPNLRYFGIQIQFLPRNNDRRPVRLTRED